MEKIKKEEIRLNLDGTGEAINAALRVFFKEGSLMDKNINVTIKVKLNKKDLYGTIRSKR